MEITNYQDGFGRGFDQLKVGDVKKARCTRINSNAYLSNDSSLISCYNTSKINIYLPPNPYKCPIIIRVNDDAPTVYGNGKQIITNGSVKTSKVVGAGRGDTGVLIFDGINWKYNYWIR